MGLDIRRFKRERARLIASLKASPCMDCGLRFPSQCMDFDHRPGEIKSFPVSYAARNTVSLKRVADEIAKCDLVCANCHRLRTYVHRNHHEITGGWRPACPQLTLFEATVNDRIQPRVTTKSSRPGTVRNRGFRQRKQALVWAAKSRSCARCGGRFPIACMDLDHRPGEVKLFTISSAINHAGGGYRNMDEILSEIAKCDPVCANCHRILTFVERDHAALC